MPSTTWAFEIWTHPRLGTPTFVAALPHAGAQLLDRPDAVVDSFVNVPATRRDLIFEALQVNPVTLSSSRSRIIRCFRVDAGVRQALPDHEFVAADLTYELASDGQTVAKISGPDLRGSADDANILPFDYPNNPSEARDWLWHGPNIFDNGDLEIISNERQSFWFDPLPASTDTFQISFDGELTTTITWGSDANQRRADVKAAMEALTNTSEVIVTGAGGVGSKMEIEWVGIRAGENLPQLTIVNHTGGTPFSETEATGGFASLEGWTAIYNPITGVTVGSQDIRVTSPSLGETGLNGSRAAVVLNYQSGADQQFSGVQVIVGVTPNQLYQLSITVDVSQAGNYRFVVRDMIGETESELKKVEVNLTVGTHTVLLPNVEIRGEVRRVTVRFAIIDIPASAGQIIADDLIIREGLPDANAGEIVLQLLSDLQTDHAPRTRLSWLTPGFDGTNDSSGAPWSLPSLPFAARDGQRFATHVLDGLGELGHSWDVAPVTLTTYELDLWDIGNRGTDHTADPAIAFVIGQLAGGKFQMRLPEATNIRAVGADGIWSETENADLVTAFGSIDGFIESEDWLDTESTTAAATERLTAGVKNALSLSATTTDSSGPVPWRDVSPGDTANFVLSDTLVAKHARTIAQVMVKIDSEGRWSCDWTGSRIFGGRSSQLEALRYLLTQFPRRTGEKRSTQIAPPAATPPSGSIPWVVAAADAPAGWKDIAGYQCDGVNDQVEIQACLDTYQLAQLSPGSFTTDTGDSTTPAITIPTGAILRGSGYQETFLENEPSTGSQPAAQTVAIKAGLYSTLSDIYVGNTFWDGGVAVATGYGCLIDRVWAEVWQDFQATALQGSAGDDLVTLRDCRLIARNSGSRASLDNESYALRINSAGLDRWVIENCDIEGGTYAVKVDGGDTMFNLQLTTSRIGFGTGWDAIWLNGDRAGYFGTIQGCHFRSYAQSSATADLAAAIRITGTGLGDISDSDTADTPLLIADCTAEGSANQNGIVVIGRAGGRVADCYFEGLGIGVLLDDASEWRILDSDFFWCGDPAAGVDTPMIRLTNATSRARVMGCTLRNEQGNTATHPDYGIEVVTADCTDNRIVGNDLEQPTGEEFVVAPILNNGTTTRFDWPADPTWGDNFV